MGYSAAETAVYEDAVKRCLEASTKLEIQMALASAMAMSAAHARELPEFYSVRDLEERWGLERKAVERLRIPRTKIGASIRYTAADVFAFESENRANPE